MDKRKLLEDRVLAAARDNGVSSVLFRNAVRRKLGLNVTDSECLSYLSIKGSATPTELARYSGLTTGSTTALLDRLEKSGYVRRTPNPQDRRGVVVQVDRKWPEASGPLVSGVQKAHRTLIAGYTEAELETIADFLTRFTANVVSQTEALTPKESTAS